ncbi:ATP-grasp domain-containing protein [Streptomyces sp. NPDC002082]|uniref:ATP-grasp domain-containing protein n=1 Tax=Streptomyces sp. NPDC002082 TaxID=3154772 RepID=UPI00332A90C5
MKKPHLLMVGGWRLLLEKAIAVGFDVSFIGDTTAGEWRDGWLERTCVDVRHVAVEQVSTCVVQAREIHARRPLTAAVSFSEFGLESAAVISDALGIQGSTVDIVSSTRYKDVMRGRLDAFPDLALRWQRVKSPEELRSFWERHGPELILKPVSGVGSEGVFEIKNEQDLVELTGEPEWQGDVPYLTEEFVPGDVLYSVETLTVGGEHRTVATTLCKLVGDPCTVVNYVMTPPPAPYDGHVPAVSDTAHRLLDALELEWGVAHTEVKTRVDGRPVVIESQNRVGGQSISRMVEWSTGVLQIDAALGALVGKKPEFTDLPPAHKVAVAFSLLAPAGRVTAVADPKVLDGIGGVVGHEISVTVGAELPGRTDNSGRDALVWLTAPSHEAAFETMRQICESYWVEYEEGYVWHPTF